MKATSSIPVAVSADPITRLTQSLLAAQDVTPEGQQRIMYAAVDEYVAKKEEVNALCDAAFLLKTIADMQPPKSGFVEVARNWFMPRMAIASERYETALQVRCIGEACHWAIKRKCSDPNDKNEWEPLQAAIRNSLAAERFALAFAIHLNVETLTALKNFPLAFAALDGQTLEHNSDGTATQQLSPWIKRHLIDDLSSTDFALCAAFCANETAVSAFEQARPNLDAAWQEILDSPLLGTMVKQAKKQIEATQNTSGTSLPGTATADDADRQAA